MDESIALLMRRFGVRVPGNPPILGSTEMKESETKLTDEQFDKVRELVDNPPEPSERLKELMKD